MIRQLLFFISILFLWSSCEAPRKNTSKNNIVQNGQSLLWEIQKDGIAHKSYLFGTFHLLCKQDIHFSKSLEQSLASASQLYLEMDLNDPANTIGILKGMNMRGDTSLLELIGKDQYTKLARFFDDTLHIGLSMFERMKPALLSSMLYPAMMPCKTVTGMETELMRLAAEKKIKVMGFETIADQTAIFDQIPYKTQAEELMHMIDSLPKYKQYFNDMLTTYLQEDLQAIEQSFSKEPGFDQQRPFLLDNRNIQWVKKLKTILPTTPVFIAVGAGHLSGKMGLIELLRREGYTVRPVDQTKTR